MSVLHFSYRMEIQYESMASRCCYTVKCIPKEDERQRLLGMKFSLEPAARYSYGEDSFGNRQIYGCIMEPHCSFALEISGDVEILQNGYVEAAEEGRTGIFRYPHGKCVPGPGLWQYYHTLGISPDEGAFPVCRRIMDHLSQDFSYAPGTTAVYTTAEAAWEQKQGVCQDYAHIYVTLLRMAGIPARYVCGLIAGEGESHAWAEACCDGRWIALDPTHNRLVNDGYIKFGSGRDAADCAINRGILWGGGRQSQRISSLVEKTDQKIEKGFEE